jgi:hypothetical protein
VVLQGGLTMLFVVASFCQRQITHAPCTRSWLLLVGAPGSGPEFVKTGWGEPPALLGSKCGAHYTRALPRHSTPSTTSHHAAYSPGPLP